MRKRTDKKVTNFCTKIFPLGKNYTRNQFSTPVYRRKREKEAMAKTNFQLIVFIANLLKYYPIFYFKVKISDQNLVSFLHLDQLLTHFASKQRTI